MENREIKSVLQILTIAGQQLQVASAMQVKDLEDEVAVAIANDRHARIVTEDDITFVNPKPTLFMVIKRAQKKSDLVIARDKVDIPSDFMKKV